jgi:hypothetical protein
MARRAQRLATHQDVLDAPEHMIAELFDGELSLQPRRAGRKVATALWVREGDGSADVVTPESVLGALR